MEKPKTVSEISEIIYQLIREELSEQHCKITPDMNCMTELGLDSLDMVHVIMAIEEEFRIEIPDDSLPVDAETITVGLLIDKVFHLKSKS